MADKVNVISITGSLRKGSFNAALARQLPKWQPAGMTITPAPDWRDLPVYNADDQNSTGFPRPRPSLRMRSAPRTACCSSRRNTITEFPAA
jgi:NAD(P)H-dependent FMN reductase